MKRVGCLLIWVGLAVADSLAGEESSIRRVEAYPCILFNTWKGPQSSADLAFEFEERFLKTSRPMMEGIRVPAPDGLQWVAVGKEYGTRITDAVRVHGRRAIRAEWTYEAEGRERIACVMLAMERAAGEGWFRPFFLAEPEDRFTGIPVVSDELSAGYVASLWFSGTGAYREHFLFDLAAEDHPALVKRLPAGRVRRDDYDSNEAYAEALKIHDREGALLRGKLEVEEWLWMPYWEFDQTRRQGWRALVENNEEPDGGSVKTGVTKGVAYRGAGRMIERYLERNGGPDSGIPLDRFQQANLHWHAGQLWARAGKTARALEHVAKARHSPEPKNSPIRWNDYVDATEAFLKGDRDALLAARERMAAANPDDANLPVVDRLIEGFGKPYREVYGGGQ